MAQLGVDKRPLFLELVLNEEVSVWSVRLVEANQVRTDIPPSDRHVDLELRSGPGLDPDFPNEVDERELLTGECEAPIYVFGPDRPGPQQGQQR